MRKSAHILEIILATVFLGLSLYACWNLQQMINDQIDYGGTLITAGADAARGIGGTLGTLPDERFLGSGILGTYAPVMFALASAIFFLTGWRGLTASDQQDEEGAAVPQPAA